jgi:hypothetical protein
MRQTERKMTFLGIIVKGAMKVLRIHNDSESGEISEEHSD